MNLQTQKRIAADILKVGGTRVYFDPARSKEIEEAITRGDIKKLIADLAIQAKPKKGNSRFRIRKNKKQKQKGRQSGKGSRKGKANARRNLRLGWIRGIRVQRAFIRKLKDRKLITTETYRDLYSKSKGGMFRSKRHIKLYLEEHKLVQNAKSKETRDTVQKKAPREN